MLSASAACQRRLAARASSRLLAAARGVSIASARPVNEGRQVDVEFADRTAYRFHVEWIRDSSPGAVGSDFYRKSARALFDVDGCVATAATPREGGSKLALEFGSGASAADASAADAGEYASAWLHAFAPFVGRPLHDEPPAAQRAGRLRGTGSLLDDLHRHRRPWGSELRLPTYDAAALAADEDLQIDFLEKMVDPGVALIRNAEPASSFESHEVGMPLERLVGDVIGRLNQHPVRATRYGVMHNRASQAGADYDHQNPLSMHTDHSFYNGTPGYLQFMYQAQGSVRSKVCDGLALVTHFRERYPEEFELLTTVQLTHSIRNEIYGKDGAYRGRSAAPATFELVHTHPVIQLDGEGFLEKVVQSETKRGVCALPYDTYERFMAAYRLWTELVEQPRFICSFDWPEHSVVAMNNWRTLHGRASVPPGVERTMCFGYIAKTIAENRYRLLRQRRAQRRDPSMSARWLTRLPNQVLQALVR